jgi:hypothetical protein
MESLQTTKSSSKKSIQEAAIPKPIQVRSHPFVGDGSHNQKSDKLPEQAKQQGFNLGQIPIFPRSSQKDDQASGNLSEDNFDVEDVEKYLEEVRNFISQSELRNTSPQELAEIAKEPQQSSQKDDQASGNLSEDDFNVEDVEKFLGEVRNFIIESEMRNARPQELAKVADEKDSVLAPIAQQMLMSSERQEPQPSTQSQVEQIIEQKFKEAKTDIEQAEAVVSAMQPQQQPAQTPPTQKQRPSGGLRPLRLVEKQRRLSTQVPQIENQPPSGGLKPLRLVEEHQQSLQAPESIQVPQEEQQLLERPLRNPLQQPPNYPSPLSPPQIEQEVQQLLNMDRTPRQQRLLQLHQQQRQRPEIMNALIQQLQTALNDQQSQQPEAEPHNTVNTPINKPSKKTQKNKAKQDRKETATAARQYEPWADATGILGQPSGQSTADNQMLGQNLDANSSAQGYNYSTVKDDAAVIDMTRDEVKAATGLLLFADSAKQLKAVLKDKKKKAHERIAIASNSLGEMTQAITYSTISINQGIQGAIERHQTGSANLGALAAAKQGGTIAGTSLPTDIGKTVGGVLTTIPRAIMYTDAGIKASKEKNFGGYKSWGRGVKNVGDLTRAAAGAVKDASSLVQHTGAGSTATADAVKIISGGAVAPFAHTVVGSAEAIQGGVKFAKAYNNKNRLDEIKSRSSEEHGETLDKLKEIQKKKITRATINHVLGDVGIAAGVVGFTAGPPGLIAATSMGGAIGAFQLGQWGTRKLKQYMRDKAEAKQERTQSNARRKEGIFSPDTSKSTKNKRAANERLTADTLSLLNAIASEAANDRESILSSIGLNGNKKKDNAIQDIYNDMLQKYLNEKSEEYVTKKLQDMAKQGTVANIAETRETLREEFLNQKDIQDLKQRGHKQNLKEQVTWNNLNQLPEDLRKRLQEAAIAKALNQR